MLIRVTVNKTLTAYKGDANYTLARGSQARVKVHPLISKADQLIAEKIEEAIRYTKYMFLSGNTILNIFM